MCVMAVFFFSFFGIKPTHCECWFQMKTADQRKNLKKKTFSRFSSHGIQNTKAFYLDVDNE